MRPIQKFRVFYPPLFTSPSKPFSLLYSPNFCFSSSSGNFSLTEDEIKQVNLLIPRLCSSNHLNEAICLVHTALLTNPPPKSLSLSILIHSLSSEPDLTQSMFFLNRIKHTSLSHSSLLPITKMLISSYFKKGNPKHALKVFNWALRSDSPCALDSEFFAVSVYGFCRNRMVLEVLKALRVMVGAGLVPGPEIRMRVFRGLLMEARIREAQELNEALGFIGNDVEGAKKVMTLLDDMIANWVE